MKLKFKRKSVNVINFYLKSVGVNVTQQNIPLCKFYQFSAIAPTISAIIHMSLYILVNRDHISNIVVLAAYMGASIVLVASVRTFLQNKTKILKMMQIIDQNVYLYSNEKIVNFHRSGTLLDEKNSTKVLFLILGYEFFGFSLSVLSPFVAFLITDVYEVSMYPGWYPTYDKSALMMITTVLQLGGCISTFWLYYVIQIFISFVTIEFLRQYQRLGIILKDLPRSTKDAVLREMKPNPWYRFSNITGVNFEYKFERKCNRTFQENILHCIKHHQQLCKLFHLFEPWFSTFYSMELIMSAATFALVFYNLLSARNPSTFLTIIGSTFNVWANVFSRCIVGEMFVEMNSSIKSTIFYEMNWWELSIENRKLLMMFHETCSQSFEFKGCSIFTASYYTFSQLMRTSYSYFNILRSSLKNN